MSDKYVVKIEGRAVPFTRHYGEGKRAYNSTRYNNFRTLVGWMARIAIQGAPMLSGPVFVVIEVFISGRRPGDLDNYGKAALDGLQGIFYEDDRCVESVIMLRSRCEKDAERMILRVCEVSPAALEKIRGEAHRIFDEL